jgi:hypothetical protein
MNTDCWCGQPLTAEQIRRGNKSCNQSHATTLQHRQAQPEQRKQWAAKANESRRQQFRRRVVSAIVADLKAQLLPLGTEGPVDIGEVVKVAARVVVKHRRLGYEDGWSANYQRRMRALAS